MTDISINGRKLSKFNPVVTLDNEDIYSQKDLDGERESVIYTVLEIIDKHITSWSGKRYGNPTVMGALVKLRDDIESLQGGDKE